MNKIFTTLLLSIFLSCNSASFEQNIEVNSTTTGLFEKIDSIVVNKMNQYNIPGLSIGIVQNDSIIYTKGYGVRNINNPGLVSESTIFHTASISKLFTALAIMKLQESKILSIDDRLIELVPELNYSDPRVEKITLKSLLNHTSGLPDLNDYGWSNNNQSDNSLEEFVLGLDLKVESEPSSQYAYSNLAYDILGYVIEKATGSTFEKYLKENILNQNGMYNSDFRYFKIPDSLRTSPHSKSWITSNIYVRETYPYTREHAPSGTLNSSARELSTWMASFLKLLDGENSSFNYESMISPSTDSNEHIGLGFQLAEFDGFKKIGHYGGDKGFRSYLMMIPEEKMGLILLANCDYEEDFRQEILHPIAKLMLTKS
ncbi:MAG: serine hydrolase domain-containing protein [Bacteroidota bacterium]